MESLSLTEARRLALARAGLFGKKWAALPTTARGSGPSARAAAHAIIDRFGYLQLDTVSVAGARSHAIVLLSRLRGLDPALGEELLGPGEPLFEYWGHEASWIPNDLYRVFEFRRRHYRSHPWWGDVISENKAIADGLLARIDEQGPLRSADLEGPGGRGWWDFKIAKRVANALWTSGDLAIRERRNFIRTYDLPERVIPASTRRRPLEQPEALRILLLRALDGHGWATKGTLASTWRLRNLAAPLATALAELAEAGEIVACGLENSGGRPSAGWIRPRDLELAGALRRARPSAADPVLLSPFDPLLWDRARVRQLFGFDQVLEIFKPAPKRVYGYYCLPVLAGETLVARVDLKANRKRGTLAVLSSHYETPRPSPTDRQAVRGALARHADALQLAVKA